MAGATVTVLRLRKPFDGFPGEPELLGEVTLQTGATGRFWLRGLEEGTLLLRASHERKSSDWERLELRESFPASEFGLRVEERELVRGVVTAGSLAIAGARVVARAVTANPRSPTGFVDTVSGPNGEIELLVPADALHIDLLVAADSYGTEILRFVRQGGGWPPFLLRLDEARGSLRMPFAGENGNLLLCRNGAAFHWATLRWVLRDRKKLNGPVLQRHGRRLVGALPAGRAAELPPRLPGGPQRAVARVIGLGRDSALRSRLRPWPRAGTVCRNRVCGACFR